MVSEADLMLGEPVNVIIGLTLQGAPERDWKCEFGTE